MESGGYSDDTRRIGIVTPCRMTVAWLALRAQQQRDFRRDDSWGQTVDITPLDGSTPSDPAALRLVGIVAPTETLYGLASEATVTIEPMRIP